MAATASDSTFDSLSEGYTFTTAALADGAHTVYVRATDSASNTTAEADYASDGFTVQSVTPGDATGDGVINAVDITKVERMIVGLD
jgi:predicted lipoprotein with Yx(FWY)xxD motif